MPGTNWRVGHGLGQVIGGGAAGGMEDDDWRTQLPPGSRHRIVYKIMETLRSHNPFSGQEDLQDLEKTAVVFEENIFNAATSQLNYLRKISLRMLALDMKSQNPTANSCQSNATSNSRTSPDPVASEGMGGSDWSIQLHPESRHRIVNKITDMLRRHLPFPGEDGLEEELKNIAVGFEENVYRSAISQSDYLRKISLKMLTVETNLQHPMVNFLQSNG